MTRSGQEYLASLLDGRAVWLGGELVKEVTEHPAFRNTARSIAHLYDMGRDSELRDVLTVRPEGRTVRCCAPTTCRVSRPNWSSGARRSRRGPRPATAFWAGRPTTWPPASPDSSRRRRSFFAGETFDGRDNLAAYRRRMTEGAEHRAGALPGIVRDGNPDLLAAFTQSCLDGYRLDELPGSAGGLDGGR